MESLLRVQVQDFSQSLADRLDGKWVDQEGWSGDFGHAGDIGGQDGTSESHRLKNGEAESLLE